MFIQNFYNFLWYHIGKTSKFEEEKQPINISQTDSLYCSGGMSEDEINSAIDKLKSSTKGKLLNLELHNITENPRILQLISQNLQNEEFNNLWIVNLNSKQSGLKDITNVLIDYMRELKIITKHIKGNVHICSYKSQNKEITQKELI